MKIFSIVEHLAGGSGHKISIVMAESNEEALALYKKDGHRNMG